MWAISRPAPRLQAIVSVVPIPLSHGFSRASSSSVGLTRPKRPIARATTSST